MTGYFSQSEPHISVMEAYRSCHVWYRELKHLEREVKSIVPKDVPPYRKRNKRYYNDAIMVAEASILFH